MKLLTVLFVAAVCCLPLQAQLTTNWERCARTGAGAVKPTWFGAGTERGIAHGNMGSGDRIYVASRNGGNSIKVLNASTGADVTLGTPFDLSGVSGGTFVINDLEMTSDNVLILGNMASAAFKLYVWTTEGGAPTAYSFTLPTVSGIRYGDKFTVVGSWAAGTVEVYVPGAGTAASGKIQVLRTTNQGTDWTTTEIALSGSYTNSVASEHIAVLDVGGSFYLGANGHNPRMHDNTGAYVASSLFTGTNSSQASSKAVTINAKNFLVTAQYRAESIVANPKITRGQIYNVTTPSSVTTYAVTPYLADSTGTDIANAVNGDVAIKDNGNGSITIFLLGTDQGIGAYTTNTAPLPVELTSFTASALGEKIELRWNTATETNNHGFEVECLIKGAWSTVGFVKGAGTTNVPQEYHFADAVSAAGKYSYRLKQIDRDGTFEYSRIVEAAVASSANHFELGQNYPNPFNPVTRIAYQLPSDGQVSLKVYDLLGKEVSVLVNGVRTAGESIAEFDASHLPSGMYFYTLRTPAFTLTKRMLLVK